MYPIKDTLLLQKKLGLTSPKLPAYCLCSHTTAVYGSMSTQLLQTASGPLCEIPLGMCHSNKVAMAPSAGFMTFSSQLLASGHLSDLQRTCLPAQVPLLQSQTLRLLHPHLLNPLMIHKGKHHGQISTASSADYGMAELHHHDCMTLVVSFRVMLLARVT